MDHWTSLIFIQEIYLLIKNIIQLFIFDSSSSSVQHANTQLHIVTHYVTLTYLALTTSMSSADDRVYSSCS